MTEHVSSPSSGKDEASREYPRQIIRATDASWFPDWGQLWNARDLLWMFVKRDLSVQYRQTVIGVAWAIIRPILTISIFTLVFGLMARLPSNGFPYHIFLFSAVVVFQYFSKSVTEAAGSLVNKKVLLTQIYFPRLIVPLTVVIVGLVDVAIGLLVFLLLLVGEGLVPTYRVLTLPLFLFLAIATAFGVGTLLSAIDVKRRDVRLVLPNIMMFWMYATPIIYPLSAVPAPLAQFYGLNPMSSVVEGFRWALLPGWPAPPLMNIGVSMSVAIVLVLIALKQFNTAEKTMADHA